MEYLHSMIRVHDLDAALDFFVHKLGLVEMRRRDSEKGRFTLVFLAAKGDAERAETESRSPMIELTYNWPGEDGEAEEYGVGRSFGHLAYQVENIYELCQSLMDAGVTIHRPPRDGRMAFIKSPDGISIELLQKGEALPIQEPWASMPSTGRW